MKAVIFPASATVNAQVKNQNSSKKTVSNLDQVLRFARKKFLNFPVQTAEIKKQLIIAGLGKYGVTDEEFYGELNNATCMLIESTKFVKDCQNHELCPFIVAQHCVFAGLSYCYDILKKGIDAVFQNIYSKQMAEHIFDYDTLVAFDGNHRLREAMNFVEIIKQCKEGKLPECQECPVKKGFDEPKK